MRRLHEPPREPKDPQSQIGAVKQHVVSKNWKFSLIPSVVLGVLLVDLCWEVIRQNMDTSEWPWKFTFLGVTPAAALSGVFATLVLARAQFAMSVRPSLSFSAEIRKSEFFGENAWTIRLMNAGPGLAHVDSVSYTISKVAEYTSCNVSRQIFIERLQDAGLHHGRDYHIRLITEGTPLPVVKNSGEGMEFAAFTLGSLEAVRKMRRLDFRVRVLDTVGDRHEKSLPCPAALAALPATMTVPQESRVAAPNERAD